MQTLIMVQNQPENPQSKPRGKKLGKSLKVWEMLYLQNRITSKKGNQTRLQGGIKM